MKKTTIGRKPVLNQRQHRQIVRLSKEKNLSLSQLAGKYGVSHMTIYRIIKRSLGTVIESGSCSKNAVSQLQAAGHNKPPRIYSSYG